MTQGTEIRAVLDTNTWLDWLLFEDPAMRLLRRALESGRVRVVASAPLRGEFAKVLQRPPLIAQAHAARARRGLPPEPEPPPKLLARFDSACQIVEPAAACGLLCSDPNDQPWLDLAVAQHAALLVSKDRALLKLARQAQRRFGLQIIAPQAFRMPDMG